MAADGRAHTPHDVCEHLVVRALGRTSVRVQLHGVRMEVQLASRACAGVRRDTFARTSEPLACEHVTRPPVHARVSPPPTNRPPRGACRRHVAW
eukprot:7379000-Prymnesium_polylepis.1